MNLALYQSQMVHMPSSGYTNKSDDAALYTYYLMIRNLCHNGLSVTEAYLNTESRGMWCARRYRYCA